MRDLYLLISAGTISLFGTIMVYFAVPLIIFTLFHSGTLMAIFELASMIPSLLLGVPIGMYLKKKNVKGMWIIGSALLGSYSLFVFFFMNPITLFILNIFSSIMFIVVGTSRQALMQVCAEKDELVWANSVKVLSMGVVGATAPAITGFILAWNPNAVFLVDSLTYLIEILLVLKIKKDAPAMGRKSERVRDIFWETMKYIRANRLVRNSILLIFFLLFVGGGLKILNIAYFTHLFARPYEYFGIAVSILEVGALSILIPSTLKLIEFRDPYRALIMATVPYTIFFLLMAIIRNPFFILGSFLILGLGNGIASPNISAIFQVYVDKEHIRQVFGVAGTLIDAAKIMSVVTMGVLVDLFSLTWIFLALAAGMALIFSVFIFSAEPQRR